MSKQQVTLVLQSFGKESEYKRAILTVLSYFTHADLPFNKTRVIFFTDQPSYFNNYFKGLPVDFVILTPEKIKEMRGEIDFLHRMKIALIEEAFSMSQGNLLYADSDTFFIADPTILVSQVSSDKCFMHLWEYEFESMRQLELPAGETFRAYLNLIETRTFQLSDGTPFKVYPNQNSWNAGVMIFHPSHAKFIPDVYCLTDQFYPDTLNHASEQYAFSIMMQNNLLIEPCDSVIYHYWYRVKKQIIDLFLQSKLSSEWELLPLEEKLRVVKKWTEDLPKYFNNHILTIRDIAIQAFNDNNFSLGYKYAFKAILKEPGNMNFIKDVLYHSKRRLVG